MKPAEPALLAELNRQADEASNMVRLPHLFAMEEILGQLLGATKLAFEIAGIGEDETQRRHLYLTIADYVDVPRQADAA